MKWILQMAWREGRGVWGQLFLFILSISVGIAALVAANSIQANIRSAIYQNAKSLLGADMVIRSRQPIPPEITEYLTSNNIEFTEEITFNSMAYFPKTDESRLVVIRGMQGSFPYYGEMLTEPKNAAQDFRTNKTAVLEDALFHQFDLEMGDQVKIGDLNVNISGKLLKNAGEIMGTFFAAPRVLIHKDLIPQTNLIQRGSLRRHKVFIKESDPTIIKNIQTMAKPFTDRSLIRIETVPDRQERVGSGSNNLNRFLNLAGFIILLMGGIGVASSIHVYIQKKKTTMAVLKCLGATGQQGVLIFSIQACALGFIGAAMGAVLGVILQKILIQMLAPLVPVVISFSISFESILNGFLIGSFASLLFSLLPLLPIRHVSPLNALRSQSTELEPSRLTKGQVSIIGLIVFCVFGFSLLYIKDVKLSLIFVGSLLLVLILFWSIAKLLTLLLSKVISPAWPYPLRQGLSNLYQPNNQTMLLLTSLGFGVFLILVLALTQHALVEKFAQAAADGRPNMGLFDISTTQLPYVKNFIEDNDMLVLQSVPIVSMRLKSIKGVSIIQLKKDKAVAGWTLSREYRSSYRDTLNNNERIIKGTWHGNTKSTGEPYSISIESDIANELGVGLGDEIVFDVSGRDMRTTITSIRKVDWYQVQPTFYMIFQSDVLKNAPQFHVLTTHAKNSEMSANLQKAAIKKFPTISIIDLRMVLSIVDQFVRQLSLVIRFVALLIIVAGFIMLMGTLSTSRFQRKQLTVLLRTLGGTQKQISIINILEYGFLAVLAAGTGLIPAIVGSWALTEFAFKSQFYFSIQAVFSVIGALILITIAICLINIRPILKQSPMTILRED